MFIMFYVVVLIFAVLSNPVGAETTYIQPKERGMSHVIITPSAKAEDKEQPVQKEVIATPSNENKAKKKQTPFQLVTFEELKPWSYLYDLKSRNTTRQDFALQKLDNAPSQAPPEALIRASELLHARGQLEKAALYNYVAQLRTRFDFERLPPANEATRHNRTLLSKRVNAKITPWVLADNARAADIFDKVEAWDKTVSYSYLPAYEIGNNRPDEEAWPDLLDVVRARYFEKTDQVLNALK